MRLVTRKTASKTSLAETFLVMNKKEWLNIGKMAGFVKTQAKNTAYDAAMRKYMDRMEYINDVLKESGVDGKIKDKDVLELAQKVTGTNYSGVALDQDMIRSLRTLISERLKDDLGLRQKYLKKKTVPEDAPTDTGELALVDQLRKDVGEDKIETYDGKAQEVSTIDPSAVSEVITPEMEEGMAEEQEIEQESLEAERLKHERMKKRKQDIAGAVHPLDLFDEAIEVSPEGSSTISDPVVLESVKEITGNDYSGVSLSPEAVEAIRTQLAEYYKPKVSADDEEPVEEGATEAEKTISDTPVGEYGPGSEDVLPSMPPIVPGTASRV